jgi:leucyl/phenylalanyl-tRNA--protein transferase
MNGEMAWEAVDLAAAELGLPVAVGGSDAPYRLLEAHRHGAFPYDRLTGRPARGAAGPGYERHVAGGLVTAFPGAGGEAGSTPLTWWNPPRRPVAEVGATVLSCPPSGTGAGEPCWIATCNQAFAEVVGVCRQPAVAGWITDTFCASVVELHQAGWSHSVEIWSQGRLIAGLFGTGIGKVFSIDAAFGSHPEATSAAVADLDRRLLGRAKYIDFQVRGADAERGAARSIGRAEYLDALLAVDLALLMPTDVRTVRPVPHGSVAG